MSMGVCVVNSDPCVTVARRRTLCRALVVAGGWALALPGWGANEQAAEGISVEVAQAEVEARRVLLIDIREPDEHATGVAPGAWLLPMSQLGSRLVEIPNDPKRPVLLVCNTQNRSRATLRKLREGGGYTNVRYVQGGMSEWRRRGLPLVPPSR